MIQPVHCGVSYIGVCQRSTPKHLSGLTRFVVCQDLIPLTPELSATFPYRIVSGLLVTRDFRLATVRPEFA